MVVCIVVDDNNGMMFNNRRQSQDKMLREDILRDCVHKKLWINEYTEMQFIPYDNVNIVVDNEFLDKAEEDDVCFVESNLLSAYQEKITKIVLYKWNRNYPADFYFDVDLSDWKLELSTEFVGSSHDKITKEVWVR